MCSLAELGGTGRENICLEVMAYVRHVQANAKISLVESYQPLSTLGRGGAPNRPRFSHIPEIMCSLAELGGTGRENICLEVMAYVRHVQANAKISLVESYQPLSTLGRGGGGGLQIAAALAIFQVAHPALILSFSTVLLQVIFVLPLALRPWGDHPSAAVQSFSPSLLSTCPIHFHLQCCTSQLCRSSVQFRPFSCLLSFAAV